MNSNDIKYVIIQAGGKGIRMGRYAENKPKCLVPVKGIPMIMNTIEKFKDKEIIIIADYKADVLETYLINFCKYNFTVCQTTEQGTAGGLSRVMENVIPDNEPFILTWADLFFEETPEFVFDKELLVGLSDKFKCRWKLEDNKFVNEASTEVGVAGFFAFKNKEKFSKLSISKSLVRGFLSENYTFDEIESFTLSNCFEVGEVDKYENLIASEINHRFFNEVIIDGNKVIKKCIDPKYEDVHNKEKLWYNAVSDRLENIPKIHSYNPFTMEKINGDHLWDIEDDKEQLINNFCDALDSLHNIAEVEANNDDMIDVYLNKTKSRVEEVRSLIRDIDEPMVKINSRMCINPLCDEEYFVNHIKKISNIDKFNIIHGDNTFSNTIADENSKIWFIDPRGVFGNTPIYGDRRYDYAKLYYSAYGNYDSINSKDYRIKLGKRNVDLEIKSNGYEEYADLIIKRSGVPKAEIQLIHACIWFALTGYVKEDYDAVLFAFYKGCQLWTEAVSD